MMTKRTWLLIAIYVWDITSLAPIINAYSLGSSLNQSSARNPLQLKALPSLKETDTLRTNDQQEEETSFVNQALSNNVNELSIKNEEFLDNKSFFGMPSESAQSLSLLLFAQFVLFIGVGAVIPSLPLYGKEIGLSSAANGIVLSAPALALLLLAKPAGQYADKARKPAMIWGMLIIALSDLGTALAQSIIPLVIARLGLGAGRCISESGERGMLSDLAGTIPELRGRALSAQQAVMALGIAIGAPAGGFVVERYGPRAAFLCVTTAASIALILYSFLKESLIKDCSLTSGENESDESINTRNIKWKQLLQDPRWKGLSLFEVGTRFGYAAKLASIPILAAKILPGGAIGAGALLSAAGLSGLIGAPVGGYLADRIGAKNTIILTGLCSALSLVLVPISLLNFFPIPNNAAFTAAVLLWSMSAAAMTPASTAYAQEISPKGSTATAMALPRAAGDAVFLVAPFLLGLVSDANVPIGSECFCAGLCGLLGVVALKSL